MAKLTARDNVATNVVRSRFRAIAANWPRENQSALPPRTLEELGRMFDRISRDWRHADGTAFLRQSNKSVCIIVTSACTPQIVEISRYASSPQCALVAPHRARAGYKLEQLPF
jgi:hypothetical protein